MAVIRKDDAARDLAYSVCQGLVNKAVGLMSLNEPPPDGLESHFYDSVETDYPDATLSHIAAFLREFVSGRWLTYGRIGVDTMGRAFAEFMAEARSAAAKVIKAREFAKEAEAEAEKKAAHEYRLANDAEYAAYWHPDAARARALAMIDALGKSEPTEKPAYTPPARRQRPQPKDPNAPIGQFGHLLNDYYDGIPS